MQIERCHRTGLGLALAALLLCATSAASAEPLFSFDATPGKLPKAVVPSAYTIELAPDLQTLAVEGSEVADVGVREPVSRMVLNAVNMAISEAILDDGAQRAEISLD